MSKMFRNMMAKEEFEDGVEGIEENEVAAEEGEAVEATEEITADTDEVEMVADGVEDASADVEELESIEGALEEAVADEDHPGLEEVAVESIKATLRMIQRNNGLDTRSSQRLVAKENFTGSISSRRSNTRAVLLSIKETIVNLWEKIKAAIKSLWESIKKFWNKHFSTLGRLKKAVESMKKKARAQKGMPDYAKELKPSAGLKKAFYSKDDVSTKLVMEFFSRHDKANDYAEKFQDRLTRHLDKIASGVEGKSERIISTLEEVANEAKSESDINILGSNESPLVGGFYATIDTDVDRESLEGDKGVKTTIKYTMNKETSDIDFDTDTRDLTIASKAEIDKILEACKGGVKYTEKMGSEFQKREKKISDVMKKIDNNIRKENADEQTTDDKARVALMKAMNGMATLLPNINAKNASLNVTLIKASLSFVAFSLKNYRKSGK